MPADPHMAAARTTAAMAAAAGRGDLATALRAYAAAPPPERALVIGQLAEMPALIIESVGGDLAALEEIVLGLALQEGPRDDH